MKQNIKIAKQLIKLAKQLINKQNLMTEINIKKELEKVKISEYLPFMKIHAGEWVSYPINRNSTLPDLYVYFRDGKVKIGYNFLDANKVDYESAEQDSIPGLLEELAIVKDKIKEIIINIKNEALQQKKQNQEEQMSPNEQEDTMLDDEVLTEQEEALTEQDEAL